jgi:hypothetical protein
MRRMRTAGLLLVSCVLGSRRAIRVEDAAFFLMGIVYETG